MLSLSRKYAQHLYMPWLQQLVDFGDVVDVRGRQTREFLDCVSVIEEPWHHCILIPSRRWNPWIAISEALWILSGRNDLAALKPYNNHITDYSDDGFTMYGAYGTRIFDQIDEVIARLQKDPSDRRAVLQIWDGNDVYPYSDEIDRNKIHNDLVHWTKDPPCNVMVLFKLRQNKLHMTVICRSNDLHFGLFAVNIPTFGILQEYIAARLGVDIGTQTHFSNSLHIYTDDERAKAITRRMMYDETGDALRYPEHRQVFIPNDLKNIQSHREFAEMCSDALEISNAIPPRPYPTFLAFAKKFLGDYHKRELSDYISFPEFNDWVLAGKVFSKEVWHNEQ